MESVIKRLCAEQRGAALIIVLAFVVLFAGVGVAYLSRTTSDRQVAHSSFKQSDVDQLVQSAVDNVIGDLRQEVTNGSTATVELDGTTVYLPRDTGSGAAANMVPQRSGNTALGPNLIRRSIRSDGLSGNPAPPSRASAVNSTTDASANGRSITLARWNTHYLLPKANTSTDDSYPPSPLGAPFNPYTPVPNGFTPPDWVFVTPRGATIINSPNSSVIGRYSYAVYAEGGLLDMNVAGYPTGTTADATRAGRKGSVGFADLTHLCPTTDCTAQDFGIPNPNASGVYQIDRVVGWRNYATTQPSNNFPDTGPPANKAFAYNFQTGTGPATAFYNYVLNNTNGFLSPSTATAPNGRTDQVFVQRQALIGFRTATQFSANALQYLSTFSRETNAPSFSPSTPAGSNIDYAALATTATAINPNFLLRRVTTGFTRFDGTTSIVGEPLVKTRFPLSRLAWITYKGPSAAVYALNNNDPVITALLNAGVSLSTITAGTAANVKACFGLCFGTTCAGTVGDPSNPWTYSNPTGTGQASRILRLDEVAAAGREPDFFELLQAGILSGSLGQDTGGPGGTRGTTGGNVFPDVHMNSTIQHLLTIGACIIDQADPDSIPARIQFTGSNGNAWTAYGVENLPYIAQIYPLAGQSRDDATNTKWATYLLFQLWNPHQSPVAVSNNVRLRVDGGIGIFTGGNTPPQTWNPATTANIYPPVGQAQPTAVILCPPGRTSYSFSTPKSIATDYTNTNTTAPGGFAFLLSPPSVP